MNKTDKPFACTSEGCQMTFTNEDHLNIHQKKHDMVLNLGLTCKANAFADQTPTPTRFIRNCEEVGLFQDLQNVNPFDETFRKAIEHSKNGVSHVPEPVSSDDTLHTPHIFPHITEENIDKFRRTASDDLQPKEFSISNVPTINDDLIKMNGGESGLNKITAEVIDLTACEDDSGAPALQERGSTIPGTSETSSSNSLDILNYVGLTSVSASTKSQVKEKIKVALQNKKQDATTSGTPPPPPSLKVKADVNDVPEKRSLMVPKQPRKRIGPKCKSKNVVPSVATIQAKTSLGFYDKNLNETEKRRAMNRVAQMRSRERKKIWLDQMEAEITKVKAENKSLLLENQHLKDENMLLKTILLNHNNCSLSSLEEVPALINAHRSRQMQKDKKLPTIVPKPPSLKKMTPINLTPVTIPNSPSPISSPLSPKIIFTPFVNSKRKRLIDEGMKLPKLMAKPLSSAHKIEAASDSIIIFLE